MVQLVYSDHTQGILAVQLVYSWCTVGAQLVHSWYTLHLVYSRCTVQSVYSWCTVGVQLVYTACNTVQTSL